MDKEGSVGEIIATLVFLGLGLVVIGVLIFTGITTSIDDGNFAKACLQEGGIRASQSDLGRICVRVEDLIEVKENH